jgi:hypothetical protein
MPAKGTVTSLRSPILQLGEIFIKGQNAELLQMEWVQRVENSDSYD